MNTSPRPKLVVGIFTAISFADAIGTDSSTYSGSGTDGWRGLWSFSGFHSGRSGNLFDKSFTISEQQQNVGGFGAPPYDNLRQR